MTDPDPRGFPAYIWRWGTPEVAWFCDPADAQRFLDLEEVNGFDSMFSVHAAVGTEPEPGVQYVDLGHQHCIGDHCPDGPMPEDARPDRFAEAVIRQLGEQQVYTMGDNPGARSIYDGTNALDLLADFYRRFDDLPPRAERISVHPDELDAFLARFPRAEQPARGLPGPLGSLLSAPVVTDEQVPLNVIRVRRGGKDTDYPLRHTAWMWPKGYDQPEAARQVGANPEVFVSAPLRRIPRWRRWCGRLEGALRKRPR